MFYAANIPLLNNDNNRLDKFSNGIRFHLENNRRAHILYGDYEHNHIWQPKVLDPIQNSYFEKYHPSKGNLTVASDIEVINRLVEELKPHMKFVEVGYVGATNALGVRHGYGIYNYDDGDIYEGEWIDDKRHGYGKFKYQNGLVYEGEFVNGKKHGKGKYTNNDGSVLEGEWENDKQIMSNNNTKINDINNETMINDKISTMNNININNNNNILIENNNETDLLTFFKNIVAPNLQAFKFSP